MLSFTRAGAVATPTTVQMRVTRRFPGRVAAGAPIPTRSLSRDELIANLRHFTLGMRGPRTRACDALVLSGLALDGLDGLEDVLRDAREWGLKRVTLHAGALDVPTLVRGLDRQIDAAAVTVRSVSEAQALAAWHPVNVGVTAVVPLIESVLGECEAICRALVEARPERVVLTWPFPTAATRPPTAARAASVVPGFIDALDAAAINVGVKGLPACSLGGADRLWRSHNRWYVDAEHQLGEAILFFPDVVRFAKEDACRYCLAESRCDGVPDAWLRHGLVEALVPFEAKPESD